MNATRGRVGRGLPSLGDDGIRHPPPPDEPGRGPGRGGRSPGPARRIVPWIALGMAILAFERLMMLPFLVRDLAPSTYLIALVVGLVGTVGGAIVGLRAFLRAFAADRG